MTVEEFAHKMFLIVLESGVYDEELGIKTFDDLPRDEQQLFYEAARTDLALHYKGEHH